MIKIWQRHFLKETFKTLFLILFCFYGLFVLIDYATHSNANHYHHSTFKWTSLAYNYLLEFILHMDILIPFALVVAMIKTLTDLSIHNEFVALLASGIKLKTLMRPFILIGLFFTLLIYLSYQFALPYALKETHQIHSSQSIKKNHQEKKFVVQNIALKDHTTILFQNYNPSTNEFFDVYWIKSKAEIFRMKYLTPGKKVPLAKYVDHLVKNDLGKFQKVNSFNEKTFPEMRFNRKTFLDTLTLPEELSLAILYQKSYFFKDSLSEREAHYLSTFLNKMVVPWLCLLAVLGPAPFCVRFSRYFPVFFLYAFGFFGLITCYLMIEASTVLAMRQLVPAAFAILAPFSLWTGFCFWKYSQMR